MGNESSTEYSNEYTHQKQSRGVTRSSSLRTNRPSNFQTSPLLSERKTVLTNSEKETTGGEVPPTRVKKKGIPLKRSNTFTAISTLTRPLFQSSKINNHEETTKKSFSARMKWRSNDTTAANSTDKQTKKQRKSSHSLITERPNEAVTTSSIEEEDQEGTVNVQPSVDDQLFVPRKTKSTTTIATTATATTATSSTTTTTTDNKPSSVVKVTISTNGECQVCTEELPSSSNSELIYGVENIIQSNTAVQRFTATSASATTTTTTSRQVSQTASKEDTISDMDSIQETSANIVENTTKENKMTVSLNNKHDVKNTLADVNSESTSSCSENLSDVLNRIDDSNDDAVLNESLMMKANSTGTGEVGDEDEGKRQFCTPAEKRRKNVLRSRSMNYHINRPKLSLQTRSTSIEDKLENTDQPTPLASISRSRRGSDSSLLKEHHVKRSEQFSLMLKQIRQDREIKLKLHSNDLGVITENSAKESSGSTFKSRRKCDYIDAWLKDQSKRIDVLAEAVRGDSEKVNRLRASFRERSLKTPQKDLLPQRPRSAKLPRRNKFVSLISSSDSDELDENFQVGKKSQSGSSYLDKNGNMITRKQQNTLKKQLSDTLILVDKSFKHINNKELLQNNRRQNDKNFGNSSSNNSNSSIKFQSATLGKNNTNIAIVKPMQLTNTQNSSHDLKRNENNGIEDIDKTTLLHNNRTSSSPPDISTRGNTNETIVDENKHTAISITDNRQRQQEEKSSDVHRISQSLDQVMGDLKTLRNQDIDLAKQLIGLGKSIKEFKIEQHDRTSLVSDEHIQNT